ncbi:MAG: hypothetical protein K8U03_08810 [Planctomycetia bacterium]|nr:hypothetical protein [Planctomycetia bacterium]
MPTFRELAFGWIPSRGRDERLLADTIGNAKRLMATFAELSIDDLREQASIVRREPNDDRALQSALALFAAASQWAIGLMPFDVQLRAAAAMALGRCVEMRTGEGKSLAVAAAASALALRNRSVHVATVNQYLAERDYARFAPALELLGISVGVLKESRTPDETRLAYSSSVVYGTGYAFGFDYLRERLRQVEETPAKLGDALRRRLAGQEISLPLQPPLDCTIVDELDSVLIDEAGTPLILSTPRDADPDSHKVFDRARSVAASLTPNLHFAIHTEHRRATLTELGSQRVSSQFMREISSQLRRPWSQYVEDSLSASLLKQDVDYVVVDRAVRIIDASTGRIFDDRRWPEGLQRAVEFAAGVPFSIPTVGAARVTRQRFFKLYRHLAGTSGTLVEAGDELRETYRSKITVVPPRLPSRLVRLPDRYFGDCAVRDRAAVAEVGELRRTGRPVLVGCRTIEVSKRIARLLALEHIPHSVLNGTQSAEEATIVAAAGSSGHVLVATNLAGRGTDIQLDVDSRAAGGLHVIGIEYHDSGRVDRQLLGRAGRQGDPGSGRFFIAADDTIWRTYSAVSARLCAAADADGEVRSDVTVEIRKARADLEARLRRDRLHVASYDRWLDNVLRTAGPA